MTITISSLFTISWTVLLKTPLIFPDAKPGKSFPLYNVWHSQKFTEQHLTGDVVLKEQNSRICIDHTKVPLPHLTFSSASLKPLKLPLKLHERGQNASIKRPTSPAAEANTKTCVWSKPQGTHHTPQRAERCRWSRAFYKQEITVFSESQLSDPGFILVSWQWI